MDRQTSESAWQQLSTAADEVGKVSRPPELVGDAEESERVQRNLRAVTVSARKLARFLDALAQRYDSPNAAEPSDAQVALDQAAAAAEDLATCSKAAVRAIEEG
ncbi:hypothetical protein [Parasphingorhabdus pacifica]